MYGMTDSRAEAWTVCPLRALTGAADRGIPPHLMDSAIRYPECKIKAIIGYNCAALRLAIAACGVGHEGCRTALGVLQSKTLLERQGRHAVVDAGDAG